MLGHGAVDANHSAGEEFLFGLRQPWFVLAYLEALGAELLPDLLSKRLLALPLFSQFLGVGLRGLLDEAQIVVPLSLFEELRKRNLRPILLLRQRSHPPFAAEVGRRQSNMRMCTTTLVDTPGIGAVEECR